jgi:polysaccharide chain length determinant protein (PEP-CTERM system associated)
MITTQGDFYIHSYIEIIFRRIWYVIIPFVIIAAGVSLYLVVTPKLYKSETMVLVTPQKIPENFIRSTFTASIQDRLLALSKEILSRTRLEQLIKEFKLYSEETRFLSMEQIIELMRNDIQFEIKSAGDRREPGAGYFNISYTGKNPILVAQVTNKLSSLFIEENLKSREQQAQGTVEFLEAQLKITKEKLQKQEMVLTGFKKQFLNELPDQRDANIRVLEQLQVSNQRIGESLKAAEDRKLIIQNKLADLELSGTSTYYPDELRSGKNGATASSPRLLNSQELQLNQLKTQLFELQAKYKPGHPDILITKKKIADLEGAGRGSQGQKDKQESREDGSKSTYLEALKRDLFPLDREIQRLRAEEGKIKGTIVEYRGRIEKSPIREIALGQIMQDYNQTKESYQTLSKKKEEAQQAENLERHQKGEQFKIIDPARIPTRPFKPNAPRVILIGLLAGLLGGLGLAFLREQLDHSFRDADDVEATFGLKVLANIPRIDQEVPAG